MMMRMIKMRTIRRRKVTMTATMAVDRNETTLRNRQSFSSVYIYNLDAHSLVEKKM
jgi:hypothetical protein